MELFFIVFLVMLVLVVAMSVGVLMGNKPITGSCGGMSALKMEVACDVCAGDKAKCENEEEYEPSQEAYSSPLAHNAMSKNN
ncbi:MAG: hypothetical protein ACI84K_000855 [Pseudohongiellaceae bacterium]|jgi:hypothetical protein